MRRHSSDPKRDYICAAAAAAASKVVCPPAFLTEDDLYRNERTSERNPNWPFQRMDRCSGSCHEMQLLDRLKEKKKETGHPPISLVCSSSFLFPAAMQFVYQDDYKVKKYILLLWFCSWMDTFLSRDQWHAYSCADDAAVTKLSVRQGAGGDTTRYLEIHFQLQYDWDNDFWEQTTVKVLLRNYLNSHCLFAGVHICSVGCN